MKYLLVLLLLTGCSSFPKRNVGMIHDYIFTNATKMCSEHGGLHYIISDQTIIKQTSDNRLVGWNDYPCTEVYKIRCQDQVLLEFDDGIEYCFISQIQLEESLNKGDSVREFRDGNRK